MTYRQIFSEIYKQNKFFIRMYLCFSLFLCVFFFSKSGISYALGDTLTETENAVLGGTFSSVFLVAANNANIPLSPSVALSCSAILSILGDFGNLPEQLQGFSFGLMDNWFFRIFAFAWAILSVLPRCSQITRIGGMMIEDLEQKMGELATLFVTFSQLAANINGGVVANASASASGVRTATSFIHILLGFIVLVLLLLFFVFIRTFMFFIDIIQIPICTLIPLTSAASELAKIAGVALMYCLILLSPGLFVVCYGLLLMLSIFFFKRAYRSVRYFREIYAKPFFSKIKGYDKAIALIHPKAPKRIMQELTDTNVTLLIPVYNVGKISFSPLLKRHDKWWLAVNATGRHLYKYSLFNRQLQHIQLITSSGRQIFTKNSLRFFELFYPSENISSRKTLRKLKKDWYLVYSNEYTHRYHEITAIIGCVDYQQYAVAHKKGKKAESQV